MKGTSENRVSDALRTLAEDMPLVYWKPPDDARNWKPADFLVWFGDKVEFLEDRGFDGVYGAAMIEVKDTDAVASLPFKELRPIQRSWIRQSKRIGLPYLLVVWWRRQQRWTVSDAHKVVAWLDLDDRAVEAGLTTRRLTSIHHQTLATTMGVDCTSEHLAGTLGAALRGEIG